ncbi:hypothetical protein ACFOHK_19645 [Falsigemmobacter intermedius]|uniref:Uncharacterized protein n=1 Tax=Falsigemmobacter intermedius TaxID=1553448 RepID=A0A451GH09_9RHOB|nr:hypothetical protein [Falsigemmobacter intermedius]RWY37331.1 hypothetical protein EP867_17410 [Falsigemmobacter intermedius]
MSQTPARLTDIQITAAAALVAEAKRVAFCRETLRMMAENYLRQAEKEPDEKVAVLKLAASILINEK